MRFTKLCFSAIVSQNMERKPMLFKNLFAEAWSFLWSFSFFRKFFPIVIGFFSVGALAWLTHVVVCIKHEQWLFLIAGAIMFPIAIVHGIGYWIGVF